MSAHEELSALIFFEFQVLYHATFEHILMHGDSPMSECPHAEQHESDARAFVVAQENPDAPAAP